MDLLTFFSNLKPDQVALGGIVTFGIFSILMGWLMPRRVHRERMADKDKVIDGLVAERDNWRKAYETERDARVETDKQNAALVEGAKTTNHLLDSLRNLFERQNPGAQLPPSSTHRELEG